MSVYLPQVAASTETIKVLPLTCHGHSRPVTHLQFSSVVDNNQYFLISSCKDNNPMLRDGITGDWIGTFIGHKGAVWQSRISQNGALAATASADFTTKVWDTISGTCLHTFQHNHVVRTVAFPPQPHPVAVATAGMEKKLFIYDLNVAHAGADGQAPCYEIGGGGGTDEKQHGGCVRSITWTPDPSVLVTGCDDGKLRWWDLRTRLPIASYALPGPLGTCETDEFGVGQGGTAPGLSVAAGKSVLLFDGLRPNVLLRRFDTKYEIASVAVNGIAGRFVTGSSKDTWVRVWDLATGEEKEIGKGHHGPVWTCSFSPDGKLYATGSEDGTVKLWKSTTTPYGLWR